MYAIYGNIYHQYTPVMLAYIAYMDHMGYVKLYFSAWFPCPFQWRVMLVTMRFPTERRWSSWIRDGLQFSLWGHPLLKGNLWGIYGYMLRESIEIYRVYVVVFLGGFLKQIQVLWFLWLALRSLFARQQLVEVLWTKQQKQWNSSS